MSNAKMFIGKEILRLITIAMYDNPLTIYREYIQNSVDAIDDATMTGYDKDKSRIHINIDHEKRNITIHDNGPGIPATKFSNRMKTIGWSEKTAMPLRGIWGIGRLAGLAYCRNLVFRTKAHGEDTISRMDWDGHKFRKILSESDQTMDLSTMVNRITTTSLEKCDIKQSSFFEIQINQVVRHGNDGLLNKELVAEYLSQVAPVPFREDAPFGKQIKEFLAPHIDVSGHHIFLNGASAPVCRSHRPQFAYSPCHGDRFSDVECFEVKGKEGNPVAVGWLLHHSYLGALKNCPAIRGIRVRIGNMQIGNERILSSIFPEERFNSWSVGELHILNPGLRPNGQRSNLEDTPAFRDIKNKLVPIIGRTIAKKCREKSAMRNKVRLMLMRRKTIDATLSILDFDMLSPGKVNEILDSIRQEIQGSQSATLNFLELSQHQIFADDDKILEKLKKAKNSNRKQPPFKGLPNTQLMLVKSIADLIYDHAPNPEVAGDLLLRMRTLIENRKN